MLVIISYKKYCIIINYKAFCRATKVNTNSRYHKLLMFSYTKCITSLTLFSSGFLAKNSFCINLIPSSVVDLSEMEAEIKIDRDNFDLIKMRKRTKTPNMYKLINKLQQWDAIF